MSAENKDPFIGRLPDLSISRPPGLSSDELFIRPGAWNDVIALDEAPPPDIDWGLWYQAVEARFKVLSFGETTILIKKIQAGGFAEAKLPTARGELPPQDNTEYQEVIKEGHRAKENLCLHNLRLVPYVLIKEFHFPYTHIGNELNSSGALHAFDLIQAGNIGLILAVEKYDPGKGAAFSTYAIISIRRAISETLRHDSHNIRIPNGRETVRVSVQKVQEELTLELGRQATLEDIAEALERPEFAVRNILLLGELNNTLADTLGEPSESIEINADPEEFERDPDNIPTNDISQATEEALIDQEEERYFEEFISQLGTQEFLRDELAKLLERERCILSLHFGLDGGRIQTLEEIASQLGIIRERVRQIEGKALEKIRKSLRANKKLQISDFL